MLLSLQVVLTVKGPRQAYQIVCLSYDTPSLTPSHTLLNLYARPAFAFFNAATSDGFPCGYFFCKRDAERRRKGKFQFHRDPSGKKKEIDVSGKA